LVNAVPVPIARKGAIFGNAHRKHFICRRAIPGPVIVVVNEKLSRARAVHSETLYGSTVPVAGYREVPIAAELEGRIPIGTGVPPVSVIHLPPSLTPAEDGIGVVGRGQRAVP
jgi:hypothetical protein